MENDMKCPSCHGVTEVFDSRQVGDFVRWRRLRCMHCKRKWTTYERFARQKSASRSSSAPLEHEEPQPVGQQAVEQREASEWAEAADRAAHHERRCC